MDLTDLFPAGDFAFRLGLKRGNPADLFRRSTDHEQILAERRQWLRGEEAALYLGLLPAGEPLIEPMLQAFAAWGVLPDGGAGTGAPLDRLRRASEQGEPDLVLLKPGETGEMQVVGGAVCFPSAWSLAEKMGRPMMEVHEPVPTLNANLGRQVGAALAGLKPGAAWLRQNWSMSSSPELNQHPERRIPRLGPKAELASTWLRAERQALVSVGGGGVVFVLRIEMESLAEIRERDPESARRLAEGLRTMPAEIAVYKGLATARERLAKLLA